MYGTSSNQGFEAYTSSNLEDWTGPCGNLQNGFVLTTGTSFGVSSFWAPQVFKRNGKYYIAYCAATTKDHASQQIAIAEADSPRGPFSQKTKVSIPADMQEIDPFVFVDDDGKITIPNRDTKLEMGDAVYVVCAEADAEAVKAFIGPETQVEWDTTDDQPMVSKRIIVTNPKMNGKTLGKMHFSSVYGVNITRISRQDMDLFASRNHHFHVGDRVMVVGREDNVNRVADILGNSARRLNVPNIATIFIGIIIGILFGSIPFAIPGMPAPLKLGLAGGPLIVAILIGRFGYRIKLVTYTTTSANMMLREMGLVFFLASVGIKAGAGFVSTVVQGDGLLYVGTGFLITVIPILIVGTIARLKFKFNYFTIMGMIAGTYTDPPALAYANASCSKEAPAIGYSTVYPLSMFLRIFTAQICVLFFCAA